MPDYCIGTGDVDLENAKRTAQTMILSGTWDPSDITNPTDGVIGQLYLRVGSLGGNLYVKKDNGCTNNWKLSDASFINSIATTTEIYVDGNRADAYSPDGSIYKPFKTIQAGIDHVAAQGDNTLLKGYVVNIAAGEYDENVLMNSAGLVNLVLNGEDGVTVKPAAGNALESSANNTQFTRFICKGIRFEGNVVLSGDIDQTDAFNFDNKFISCLFQGDVNLTNINTAEFFLSQLSGNFNQYNVGVVTITQQQLGVVTVDYNAANPRPNGIAYSYLIMENCVEIQDMVISAGATVQARNGSRIGSAAHAITVSGTLIGYMSNFLSAITINAGGVFDCYGSVFAKATFVNNGTFNNYNYSDIALYVPDVPANWVAPAPDNVQDAINRLSAVVAALNAGPIA